MVKPKYRQLLQTLSKTSGQTFNRQFLPLPGLNLKLLRLSQILQPNYPLLVLMAGCHGEEPASVLSMFKYLKQIAVTARRRRVNLVIYPLVNPYGFDRNQRLNQQGLDCNDDWVHGRARRAASNVKVIKHDLKKLAPKVFASLHEDDETEKDFYLYSFGDRHYEQPLLKVGGKYFPILADTQVKSAIGRRQAASSVAGVVYNYHDGSPEDFMAHQGAEFTCCTETPSAQPLSKRIKCNFELVLQLIKFTASL